MAAVLNDERRGNEVRGDKNRQHREEPSRQTNERDRRRSTNTNR
jgi:hypothetical protein